jgi:hypothetical protein
MIIMNKYAGGGIWGTEIQAIKHTRQKINTEPLIKWLVPKGNVVMRI